MLSHPLQFAALSSCKLICTSSARSRAWLEASSHDGSPPRGPCSTSSLHKPPSRIYHQSQACKFFSPLFFTPSFIAVKP